MALSLKPSRLGLQIRIPPPFGLAFDTKNRSRPEVLSSSWRDTIMLERRTVIRQRVKGIHFHSGQKRKAHQEVHEPPAAPLANRCRSGAVAAAGVPAFSEQAPDFSGAWENRDEYFKPPKSGPGPVMSLPDVRGVLYHADYNNPICSCGSGKSLRRTRRPTRTACNPAPLRSPAAGLARSQA